MSGPRGGPVEEDIEQNLFLRALRNSFEGLYRQAAQRGEATAILVPCAECLEGDSFDQVFVETHVLRVTQAPGIFTNLLGQGVELADNRLSTYLGFSEDRTCEVLQKESMYDFSNTFKVLVIDKPLYGPSRSLADAADAGLGGVDMGDPTTDWVHNAPAIQDSFFDQINQFRKTFVQVPGCEQSTAERVREIVSDATKKLIKFYNMKQPSQLRQLDYQVSRNAYAALHSFVFPHLQRILAPAEKRLDKAIAIYPSTEELVDAIPGAHGRGLGLVDVSSCAEKLALMDHQVTPHEKIACIDEAHALLQRCVADGARAAGAGAGGAMEITGDDVLSLFILAVHQSSLQHRLAHVAHVEMYLQGAAGRSGSNEAARFEEAGYAVSALQAAFQFFLEERRHGGAAVAAGGFAARPGAAVKGSTNVFSDFLQPGAGGNDGDELRDQYQGLVQQQARAQWQRC